MALRSACRRLLCSASLPASSSAAPLAAATGALASTANGAAYAGATPSSVWASAAGAWPANLPAQKATFCSAAEESQWEEDSLGIMYPPPMARVGGKAPDFKAAAVVDGEIKSISLEDYLKQGKYVILFFYPKAFTYVCPTEIIAFSDRAKEFEALGAQLVACSTDTEEVQLAWTRMSRARGGLGYMQIPIMADTTKMLSAKYGVLVEEAGVALRGLFIINPEGVCEQITINSMPIGRSVDETLRLLQAVQYVKEHGEVCPANWKPGAPSMKADPDASMEYFSKSKDDEGAEAVASKLTPINSAKEYQAAISSGKPVVVDYWAPWCGKCRQLGPFLDDLVDKYPGVAFYKVDTTQQEALSQEQGVQVLPHFQFFKGGKPVGEPITGYKKSQLEDKVKALA